PCVDVSLTMRTKQDTTARSQTPVDACNGGIEGIIATRAEGRYTPEATSWVKIKNRTYIRPYGDCSSGWSGRRMGLWPVSLDFLGTKLRFSPVHASARLRREAHGF